MGLEWLKWWHIVILVFIAIELWGWAEKQPRLYIRTPSKLYLGSKLKFDTKKMEYVFSTTQDSSKALSFFRFNPLARSQLKKIRKFELEWELKSIHVASTGVAMRAKASIKKIKLKKK